MTKLETSSTPKFQAGDIVIRIGEEWKLKVLNLWTNTYVCEHCGFEGTKHYYKTQEIDNMFRKSTKLELALK